MKLFSHVLMILFISSVSIFSANIKLSLRDALDSTLKQLPALHGAHVGAEDARERSKAANHAWYPTITGECHYAYSQPPHEISFDGSKLKMAPDNVYDAHLGLVWEMLDFRRRLSEKESAKAGVQLADDRSNAMAFVVSYQVAALWLGIMYDKSAISIQDSLIAALGAHRDFIKKQVDGGTAISFDLSKTEVRIAGAESQKVLFENELDRRMIQLHEWTGIKMEDSLSLVTDTTIPEAPPAEKALLITKALSSRPEMKLALDAEYLTEQKAAVIDRSGNATLSVQCQVGIKDGYPLIRNNEITLEDPTSNATAGLRLNVSIWDGGRLKSRRKQAEFATQIARDSVEGVKRQITREVLSALTDCNSSWKQIHLAENIVAQADITAEAANIRYESGMATNLEYLDAQADRAQALLNRLGVRYRHMLNSIALKQAVGELLFAERKK